MKDDVDKIKIRPWIKPNFSKPEKSLKGIQISMSTGKALELIRAAKDKLKRKPRNDAEDP